MSSFSFWYLDDVKCIKDKFLLKYLHTLTENSFEVDLDAIDLLTYINEET